MINLIELKTGWIYDSNALRFLPARATHSADAPDTFGAPAADSVVSREPRPIVALGVRFRRVSANAQNFGGSFGADGGVVLQHFEASIPEGVQALWSSGQERGFFEGVTSTEGSSQVNTVRRVVTSGLDVTALVARLPGGSARIDGQLSISSFEGGSPDRTVLSVPMQIDGPRNEWLPIVRLRGLDGRAVLALKGVGIQLGGGVSDVLVEVRVR